MSEPTPQHTARVERLRRRHDDAQRRAESLAHDLAAVHEASRDSNADDEHDPEGATIAFERQQLVALLEQARVDVAEAEHARERVLAGGDASCEVCGGTIPAARLEVRPAAVRCVACATAPARVRAR